MKTAAPLPQSFFMIIYLLFGLALLSWPFVWLASLIGFVWARRSGEKGGKSARNFFVFVSGMGAVLGLLLWLLISPPTFYVYWQEFNEFPSRDVTDLKGTSSGAYDSNVVDLCFKANTETIERLAKTKSLLRIKKPVISPPTLRSEPQWQVPAIKSNWLVFSGRKEKSFASEEVSLVYDPLSRTAYYSFWGVD